MSIREDAWLAGVLGRPVFAVDGSAPPPAEELADHAAGQPGGLYWSRVPTAQVAEVRQLARSGFYPVDTTVTLRRPAGSPPEAPVLTIIEGGDTHADAVEDIGARAFDATRFHLDPGIPNELADSVKGTWARNNAVGARGIACTVALRHGAPCGFLSVLSANGDARRRVIDLVAVDPDTQGRGIGRALVEAFIRRHSSECDELQVGTQAANVASLGLYASLGFRVASTAYVMHMHAAAK